MLTYFIIGVTVLVSYICFRDEGLMAKLQFNAAHVINRKEYYRLITHAFVHAGWWHLIVNMMVLFFFGKYVESYFSDNFGRKALAFYLFLYLGGILFSNAWALIKQRNNYYYNAVGASGAVSAVLFAFIFFDPWEPLSLYGIINIPGILFAAGYLVYSYIMSKKQLDNVAHDAHFLGALWGFIFPILLKPDLFGEFLDKLFRLM
ncbi:MAG: rhomboid family intramembrane serine protease [Prolixibacteraceae bacterium]|nr:rhomboid family intramembrane serine protease [Prolixibacteraceae bacterium]MBN2775491.1 rhomboid family intramembrane serine protease [Prolixibacteraceae bacterium]